MCWIWRNHDWGGWSSESYRCSAIRELPPPDAIACAHKEGEHILNAEDSKRIHLTGAGHAVIIITRTEQPKSRCSENVASMMSKRLDLKVVGGIGKTDVRF